MRFSEVTVAAIFLAAVVGAVINAGATYGVPEVPASCDAIRTDKAKAYGYHLTQMNEAQIEAKSTELDALWKQVQAAGRKA